MCGDHTFWVFYACDPAYKSESDWRECCVLCLLVVEMSNNTKQSRIIETQNGPVQGKTFTFEDNREATAFLGIPFGKPPVGELRFKVRIF